jgi:hypothetical protein
VFLSWFGGLLPQASTGFAAGCGLKARFAQRVTLHFTCGGSLSAVWHVADVNSCCVGVVLLLLLLLCAV